MNHKPPVGAPNGAPPELTEEQRQRFEALRARMEEEHRVRAALLPLFQAHEYRDGDFTMPYRFFAPENLEPGKQYPIVIFLHGLGESGTDNAAQVVNNEGAAIWVADQQAGGEPCFVLAPQCPDPNEPDPKPGEAPVRWTTPALTGVLAVLDALEKEYPIDPARRYVTGLSLGGYGSWMLNAMAPDKFAAVVSCCPACLAGGGIYQEGIERSLPALLHKPLWMFHAADDGMVPVEISRRMKLALEAAGEVRDRDFFYTEYPAELHYNHFCWGAAYGDPSLRRWLLAQRQG